MKCPKCGSENVSVQVVTESELRDQHHGFFWWILVGWWWIPVKWIFLTVPALLFKIFGHKKQRIVNKTRTYCVCQNCGRKWEI